MSINRNDLDGNKIVLATVEGGDKSDPDPQKAGRVRARQSDVHGPLVKTEHLKFIQPSVAPGTGQHETPRPPRPGQVIQLLKTLDGYSYVMGIAMGLGEAAGNFDQMVPQVKAAIEKATGMSIPPDVQGETESNRTGLEKIIKKVVEKGKEDMHKLYEGLPSHGAAPSLAGLINNPVKQVTTALTELGNNLSSNILGQLPGQLFSIGNMLNLMSNEQIDELMSNLPSEIQTAFNNMMTLKQSEKGGSLPGNFMLGGMVNPATFIPTLIGKLKNATNFGQLDSIINELASDALSETAMEGLADIETTIEGLFGEITKTISANGAINTVASAAFSQLQSLFNSLASGIPSAHGDELFGAESKIKDLMQRLKTDEFIKNVKENLEKKHPSKNAKRQKLTEGGTAGTTMGSKTFLA